MYYKYVQLKNKQKQNKNSNDTRLSHSEAPDTFKTVFQPVIQLKTSHRPLTSRRSGCHQKEIEPESERQGQKILQIY